MTAWAVGQLITMARLNDKIFGVLALADRQSNGTGTTTTEQPYLRLDGIPIVNGEAYIITVSPIILNSTVAGDQLHIRLRGNTGGNATIASTLISQAQEFAQNAGGNQKTEGYVFPYTATVTGNLSILLSYVRNAGTGTVSILASATVPARITVQRAGTMPSDTGVDL